MNHIIKKQVFDLLLDSKREAFFLQHKVSNYNQQKILTVLQKVFDEICPNDDSIYFDRLEIDLGEIAINEIKTDQWAGIFEERLRKQVENSLASENAQIIFHKSNAASVFSQWLFAMQRGYLPWNATVINDEWYQKVLASVASDHLIAEDFRLVAKNNFKLVERIVLQHPVSFLISLLESLTAEKQNNLAKIAAEFYIAIEYLLKEQDKTMPFSQRKMEVEIWKVIFSIVLFSSGNISVHVSSGSIIEQLITISFTNEQIKDVLKTKKLRSELPVTLPVFEKIARNNILNAGKKIAGIKKENTQEIETNNKGIFYGNKSFFEKLDEGNYLPAKNNDENIFKNNTHRKIITDIIRDEVFVKNAGVVLIHPFLHSFFKILGHISDGKFVEAAFHQKALCLVHFLATGEEQVQEHDLLIAKIICAFPLDEPVDRMVLLTENEKAEANNLLMAAIANWSILKNTSVAGLRESFLQRPGKLYVENDSLHLHMESGSIDMLLDHLPWNLGIIKLPWMENILRVEWR